MELVIGRVARAHGVHGELVVEVRTDQPAQRFAVGAVLHGRRPRARDGRARDGTDHTVVAARAHSGRLLVRLDDVHDRAGADGMRGILFVVDSAELPASEDPDAFYDHELEGLSVTLADGTAVGAVQEVLHTAGGELLSIRTQDAAPREHLVPFVAAIVITVDLATATIVIDPPDGLLEG